MPLNELPFPKVDLFPRDTGLDLRYLRQVYRLGCPYKCNFCTIQTIGRNPDYFPIERVLAEIRAYRAHYGTHHNIYFGDETFTVNRERTLDLCRALEGEGNVMYDCQSRLNLVTDWGLLTAMERSGCRWLEVGIETVSQEAQDVFKQGVKLYELLDTLRRLRDVGLATCSFMVNGFPTQTTDDMKRSIDFVGRLIEDGLLQATYLFGLVPYPGSDLYERPEVYGMKIHHHDYRLYHEDMPPVFSSPYADPDQIYDAFIYGVRELGRAMGSAVQLGVPPADAHDDCYGSFWGGSHI
jgi:radical SAM superfamily enzyme YgiQ (UPF0313 family)